MSAPKRHFERAAIVTGGAKGIGLAIADRLARDGCILVLADLDAEALTSAETQLQRAYERAGGNDRRQSRPRACRDGYD